MTLRECIDGLLERDRQGYLGRALDEPIDLSLVRDSLLPSDEWRFIVQGGKVRLVARD